MILKYQWLGHALSRIGHDDSYDVSSMCCSSDDELFYSDIHHIRTLRLDHNLEINQGKEGYYFYVVERGTFEIYVKEMIMKN